VFLTACLTNSPLEGRQGGVTSVNLSQKITNKPFSQVWRFAQFCVHFALITCLAIFLFAETSYSQPTTPSQRLTVEKIEIQGNSKTKREIILRELTFHETDAITPALIERNWQRLSATNFFKEVEFYTRPGSEKGRIIVVIEVRERRWPYFQFEGGHSDLNGWYFVPVSLRFDNIFGRGNLMGIRVHWGDRINKLSLGYFNPKLFKGSAYLGAELFGGKRQYLYYLNSEQVVHDVEFGGLNLRFGGNHGLFKYLYFGLRSYNYRPEMTAVFIENDSVISATELPIEIVADLEERGVAAVSVGLQADLRDHINYPLNGFWGAVVAEKAHSEFSSEIDFDRLTLDMRFYKRLFAGQVLALNFKGGYVGEEAPFYERFYLGGANSLRGYPERRITPVGYATKLLQGSAELRIPFYEPITGSRKSPAYAVLFFDTGGAWLPGQEPNSDDLFKSAGFGLRFNLPIVGLARLDFAFPLDKIEENDFQLHLSLGHSF
ncbi:MAG: outer membrane protein assembly factor, partial [bacterium]